MKEEQALEAPQHIVATEASVMEASDMVKQLPHSLESLNELFGLSAALSIFTGRFNELRKHMDFINKSIDSMYKQQNIKESEVVVVVPAPNASTSAFSGAALLSSADQMIGNSDNDESGNKISCSTLENLCETMASRGLRKYVTLHMSNIEKLREEVTSAIKRAPNPGKLVLQCIGRFYLQGSRAYIKESSMVANRQASILILEFLLLSDCTSIEPSVEKEAELAAIDWRKRLINEGGISKASNPDARGLLLFVASYGIPSDFRNQDLIELIRLSDAREVSNALRRSPLLVKRIPDIIHEMVKKGMGVLAVNTAYIFGVEEQFPPETILTPFLKESKEACKKARRKLQDSPVALKEAKEKQLAAFKAVMKCLGDNMIDPMKLAGWSINEDIANLEKDISDLERKIEEKGSLKRKADEINSSQFKTQELKHPRTANGVSPQIHPNLMISQEQRASGLTDGQTFYDGRLSGQLSGYPGVSSAVASSLSVTAGAGSLHRTIPGNLTGASTGHAAGAGSYLWHGNGALNDSLMRQKFMGMPALQGRGLLGSAPTMEQDFSGQPSTSIAYGNRNSGADLYQFADAV